MWAWFLTRVAKTKLTPISSLIDYLLGFVEVELIGKYSPPKTKQNSLIMSKYVNWGEKNKTVVITKVNCRNSRDGIFTLLSVCKAISVLKPLFYFVVIPKI